MHALLQVQASSTWHILENILCVFFKCVILLTADEGTNLLVLCHGGEVLQYDPLLHGQVQGHQAVRPNHVALHLRPATVAALI